MEIFSLKFAGILAIAIAVLSFRMRKKRPKSSSIPRKHIAIKGEQIVTPYSKETPIDCLLADGARFGPDYQIKEQPELPHGENCRCEVQLVFQNTADLFSLNKSHVESRQSDLGELTGNELRYYKYRLINFHADADEAVKKNYTQLAERIDVDEDFRQKVNHHLK